MLLAVFLVGVPLAAVQWPVLTPYTLPLPPQATLCTVSGPSTEVSARAFSNGTATLARFTFTEPGPHSVRVEGGAALEFVATPREGALGFVRVGANKQHFVDNHTHLPFIPLGINIAWPPNASVSDAYYETYFAFLNSTGANMARVWLGPSVLDCFNALALLRERFDTIDAAAASRVDKVLEAAQKYGVRVLLTLESFNSLCPHWANSECKFDKSVWNAKNGGPLGPPLDFLSFWDNAEAVSAWESYMREVVARWAAYPSLFGFELFNEVDAAMFEVVLPAYKWHSTMAALLRSVDPYGHLVLESFGLPPGDPIIDAMPEFDATSTHYYARTTGPTAPLYSADLGVAAAWWTHGKQKDFAKPSFLAEFGCNDYSGQIITREALHDGIIAPLFAPGAGAGFSWYWDTIPQQWLEEEFSATARLLGAVLEKVPSLASLQWTPLSGTPAVNVSMLAVAGSDPTTNLTVAALAWLHADAASNPCSPPPQVTPTPSFLLTLPLPHAPEGKSWLYQFVNTTDGAVLHANGTTTPEFTRDLAVIASLQ
eukprot:Hpha_TRINITY_DN12724_c0_g1::TRINITY_DN12724_c0_g1_i1::g.114417::m.114417